MLKYFASCVDNNEIIYYSIHNALITAWLEHGIKLAVSGVAMKA